jgi:hypothetical protein
MNGERCLGGNWRSELSMPLAGTSLSGTAVSRATSVSWPEAEELLWRAAFRVFALRLRQFAPCSGAPSHSSSQGSGLRRFSKWDYSGELRPAKWGID